jgi:hypothetical protein
MRQNVPKNDCKEGVVVGQLLRLKQYGWDRVCKVGKISVQSRLVANGDGDGGVAG